MQKGVEVSFDTSLNAYRVNNKSGRAVAIINLFVGMIIGFMLLLIGYLAKEQPFIAMSVFVACLLIVWWRIHLVFRNIQK